MKSEQVNLYANLLEKIKELQEEALLYLRQHQGEVKQLDSNAARKMIAYPGDLSNERILKLVRGVEALVKK